jgi:hypothetical protein
MKQKLLVLLLGLTQTITAQNFTELTQTPPFEGVYNGSSAFADVDGDNDQDILITGLSTTGESAKLYTNDGNGNYTEVTGTPFDPVERSSIAFADVDGDNDQDVLISGQPSGSGSGSSKLYTNDGNGNYTLVAGTPFDGVQDASIAFADVDGDNDQDVLITGQIDPFTNPIAKLYTNDGNGNFTVVAGTPFDGVQESSIAFADVDGDNDQDVLITGWDSGAFGVAKLYTNDGNGNFTEVSGTPFDEVGRGAIAFADVDGDNDQDVLITGFNLQNDIAKLYTNDGNGNYSLVTGTPFEGVKYSYIAFADVDGDNDQDVLIAGQNNSNTHITKLYTNDGAGNYTEVTGTPFDGLVLPSIAFADVDGDNDQDVFVSGANAVYARITKIYENTPAPAEETEVITACESYTWRDQVTYTSSTSGETFTVPNAAANGADSIYTLDLTILEPTTGDTTAAVCGSFEWYGTTYTSSATPTQTFVAANGCDSVVTLDLTINQPNTGDTTATVCGSFEWYGTTYTSSSTPTHTLTNVNGCDSVVTLNLTINTVAAGTDVVTACDSHDWIDGNTYNSSNNTATHTIVGGAENGCDSIVSLNLTIVDSPTPTITQNGTTLEAPAGFDSYQWYDDNGAITGATSESYSPMASGNYYCIAEDNGCTGQSNTILYMPTGVGSISAENLKVYPNPAKDVLYIRTGDMAVEHVRMLDVTGKEVARFGANVKQLDVSTYEGGMYVLEVTSTEGRALTRILIH